mmetsp:Transcript_26616/g.74470  ORF Transcript_26616/g.74470 Transcript_26616/m.74470 type:complete len:203 (-) Transcript_26616:209-817(-)
MRRAACAPTELGVFFGGLGDLLLVGVVGEVGPVVAAQELLAPSSSGLANFHHGSSLQLPQGGARRTVLDPLDFSVAAVHAAAGHDRTAGTTAAALDASNLVVTATLDDADSIIVPAAAAFDASCVAVAAISLDHADAVVVATAAASAFDASRTSIVAAFDDSDSVVVSCVGAVAFNHADAIIISRAGTATFDDSNSIIVVAA